MPRMPLGGNKQRGKLSSDNNVKDLYLGSTIRGQFSGWQFFGGNYHYTTILWGKSLSTTCLRANYPGAINGEAIFWGALIRRAIILGAIIIGAIVQETIFVEAIIWGQWSRGQLSGGQLSGGLNLTTLTNSYF